MLQMVTELAEMRLPPKVFWFTLAAMLAVTGLPFLYGWLSAGDAYVFGGFLFNPLDQNSYLAKMYQGWQGHWRYHLAFTASPGEGAYLFMFYLFLGHLARWLALPLVAVYHLARLSGAAALLWAAWGFFERTLPSARPSARGLALLLTAFGSGMGWVLVPFGRLTADFWVAEAYPFLSAYATPHFAWGLALMLWLLTPHLAGRPWRIGLSSGLMAVLLASMLPFGAALCLVVWGGWMALEAWREERLDSHPPDDDPASRLERLAGRFLAQRSALARLMGLLLGSGAVLLYDEWVTWTNPILAAWNAQNLTPTPPLWDVFISFAPVILLAIVGALQFGEQSHRAGRLLVTWAVLGLTLIYLPLGLQRRFMTGLYLPLIALAVVGLDRLAGGRPRRYGVLVAAVLMLSSLTNLLVFASGLHGIGARDPMLYLSRSEYQALTWLARNAPAQTVVLAAPETGLFIPAYTGLGVLYGHPFETPNAAENKTLVQAYFTRPLAAVPPTGVDLIFVGPREIALAGSPFALDYPAIYRSPAVTIYQVTR